MRLKQKQPFAKDNSQGPLPWQGGRHGDPLLPKEPAQAGPKTTGAEGQSRGLETAPLLGTFSLVEKVLNEEALESSRVTLPTGSLPHPCTPAAALQESVQAG